MHGIGMVTNPEFSVPFHTHSSLGTCLSLQPDPVSCLILLYISNTFPEVFQFQFPLFLSFSSHPERRREREEVIEQRNNFSSWKRKKGDWSEMDGLQRHYALSCSYLHEAANEKSAKDNKMVTLYSYEPARERNAKSTWWWNEAERKRKRRVAKYKFYATEGKIKRSLKKGFRWFKIKCIKIVSNL